MLSKNKFNFGKYTLECTSMYQYSVHLCSVHSQYTVLYIIKRNTGTTLCTHYTVHCTVNFRKSYGGKSTLVKKNADDKL